MIDEEEEDVEKLLKRKISWKSVFKGLLGLILLGGAFTLITISRQGGEINITYFMFGIVLLCIASSVMVPVPKKKNELRHTVSIHKCAKCGNKRVHDYKEGDFVHKDSGIMCEECAGNYKIFEVYSIKLKARKKTKTT
ncbi:MAG: hypothetical protein EU530_06815 [Promethearchaeota archaeon]|nr:MAG: hypothetical protein EU530_06815 [Candidatus Lokiarchaeota archaeon]